MKQEYHSNASTNVHLRLELSKSNLTNSELEVKYNISEPTVSKWKNRAIFEDKSSRPHTIHYALNDPAVLRDTHFISQYMVSYFTHKSWLPERI